MCARSKKEAKWERHTEWERLKGKVTHMRPILGIFSLSLFCTATASLLFVSSLWKGKLAWEGHFSVNLFVTFGPLLLLMSEEVTLGVWTLSLAHIILWCQRIGILFHDLTELSLVRVGELLVAMLWRPREVIIVIYKWLGRGQGRSRSLHACGQCTKTWSRVKATLHIIWT